MATTSKTAGLTPLAAWHQDVEHPARTAPMAVATDPGRCRRNCPGGSRCCLDSMVHHKLCVCADERCVCHGAARYEAKREKEPAP